MIKYNLFLFMYDNVVEHLEYCMAHNVIWLTGLNSKKGLEEQANDKVILPISKQKKNDK